MPIATHIQNAVNASLSAFPAQPVRLEDLGALPQPCDVLTLVRWTSSGKEGQRHAEGLALVGRSGIQVFSLVGWQEL